MSIFLGVQGSNIDMKKTIIFSKSDIKNKTEGKSLVYVIQSKRILSLKKKNILYDTIETPALL